MFRLASALALAASLLLPTARAWAFDASDRPWRNADALLVIDPYEDNDVDFNALVSDPKVKGIIHRAAYGLRVDVKFTERAEKARRHGLLWGGYLLGLKGDPIQQADFLLSLASRTETKLLALDIEDLGGPNMTLPNAEIFVKRIFEKTGQYPLLYVNASVARAISEKYDQTSVFAKTPLWIARFVQKLPALHSRVWSQYTLWQFASELNCPEDIRKTRPKTCERFRPYVVPGIAYDVDVNVFNGDTEALKALFRSP